jgi:hypothetical protein
MWSSLEFFPLTFALIKFYGIISELIIKTRPKSLSEAKKLAKRGNVKTLNISD